MKVESGLGKNKVRHVLFCAGSMNMTPYSEYLIVAELLKKRGVRVGFLLSKPVHFQIVEKVFSLGCDAWFDGVIVRAKEVRVNEESDSFVKKHREANRGAMKKQFFFLRQLASRWIKSIRLLLELRRQYKNHVVGFERQRPDCIVLYGDRNLGIFPAVIKAAKRLKIPTFVLQIASPDVEFLIRSRKECEEYWVEGKAGNEVAAALFKSFVKGSGETKIIFYPWYQIYPLFILGMLPAKPWSLGDSFDGELLLVSEYYKDMMRSQGASLKRCSVVGQVSLDVLYEMNQRRSAVRASIVNKYFNKHEGKVIVFSLPQFFEHHIMTWNEAKVTIQEMVDSASSVDGCVVLLVLHPKMKLEDYSFLEHGKYNVSLARDERLSQCLVAADMFLSCFESTLYWAICCKIIPVYLDYFELGFSFESFPSVQVLEDRKAMQSEVSSIFDMEDKIKALLKEDAERMSPFDGKAEERLVQAILG